MRLKILGVGIFVFLFLVACNLFYLQLVRGSAYYRLSINNSIRVIPIEGPRGRILDRNGVVLADNRHSFDVAIIPQQMEQTEEIFTFLSRALKVDKKRLQQKFAQKKLAPFAPVVVAEDISKEKAMLLEENRFRFPGIYIQESFSRAYPFHEVGSHVLGYVGKIDRDELEQLKDGTYSAWSVIGKNGVEYFYDEHLRGVEGGLQVEVNSRGRQMHLLGVRDPAAGKDVQLTIDQRVQQMAYDGLNGRKGAVMIMSLDSGEVLGLVSSPAYDPNIFVDSQLKSKAGEIIRDPQAPLLNRVIKGLYPPGSVFKIIVAAAALADNKIDPGSTYVCDGEYSLGKTKFRCLHVHGSQNLLQGIIHSCNVYFYNLGAKIGPELMYRYGHLLGLGEKTDIDLPFEEKGLVPHPAQKKLRADQGWYKGNTLNMSIGQGDLLVTPIQLLRMMATIGRDGYQFRPYVLKAIDHQELVKFDVTEHVGMIPQVYEIVKNALRMVVDEDSGTAHMLDMPGFKIAGKTGTAQSVKGKESHAWFVGYTLDGNPRIAFCVFLEHGGSSYNAVALTQQILTQMRTAQIF